jgi:hypothetical protein
MLSLLTEPSDGVGFIVDRGPEDIDTVFLVVLDSLPAEYMPKPETRHDPSLRPQWKFSTQTFLLGSAWKPKLIADIERRYQDVFSFGYFTQVGKGRTLPENVFRYKYNRGYPVVGMFKQVREAVPQKFQPQTIGLTAHSPGVLTIDGPNEIVDHVMKTLEGLYKSRSAFEAMHVWSRSNPDKAEDIPKSAHSDVLRLCRLLRVDPEVIVRTSSRKSILTAAKILAGYYNQLWRVLIPEGEIEFLDAADIIAEQRPVLDDDEMDV